MQLSRKRFTDELYYYSSQFVLFFVMIISLTSGSLANAILTSLIVLLLMLMQTSLLAMHGHLPLLRLLYSFITPVGYSILRAAMADIEFTETATLLLWGASFYIGLFQALSLIFRRPLFRKLTETALSIGSALIFVLFYAYLDLRISVMQEFEAGRISLEGVKNALKIQAFPSVFTRFVKAPQHLFALFGVVSFDFMMFVARVRAINLQQRVQRLLEMPSFQAGTGAAASPAAAVSATSAPAAPAHENPADGTSSASSFSSTASAMPAAASATPSPPMTTPAPAVPPETTAPASLFVTVVSSDIVGFTDLSERLGRVTASSFLNSYYALWTYCAGSYGGRLITTAADTVLAIFGLVDPDKSPDRALNAAFAFLREFNELREDMAAQFQPADIHVSVGIHSGFVTAARIGPPGNQKLDFYGDTIAVAARLDSLCRELHQDLLVSHATYRRLSLESQVSLERISEVLLRKTTRPMPLYARKP
ncbi:MAG: adenylate/guanylate cyclase domain-containing protein [Spirochaetaceae bacterium]|nr:adenylate/guanylate cyclase domain-containing protein [Spirochaetaceae bacterium]